MLQELHHQLHPHLPSPCFPADVTAVDPQGLEGGNVANVVLLVMDIAANLVISRLLAAMKTANEGHAGIPGQRLSGQVLLLAILVGHGLEGEESIIRFSSPQLPGQLVELGKFCAWGPSDAEGFARNGVGQRISHTPLLLVITGASKDTKRTIETA